MIFPYQKETLFLGLEPTDIFFPLKEAFDLYYDYPEIGERIATDLQLSASIKKEERLNEKEFARSNTPSLADEDGSHLLEQCPREAPDIFTLGEGRPRLLTPMATYAFFILLGYLGSFEKKKTYARLKDSKFLSKLLPRLGCKSKVPSLQCLKDYLSDISEGTLDFIFEKQIELAEKQGLISLDYLLSDSTFIEANSEWPTDSGLIYRLLAKGSNLRRRLSRVLGGEVKNCPLTHLENWIEQLKVFDFDINMTCGKKGGRKKRRKFYKDQLKKMRKTADWLSKSHDHHSESLKQKSLSPKNTRKIKKLLDELEECILCAEIIHDNVLERVFEGRKVPAKDRIFSLSDRDAVIVCKGQRVPIIGYRPTYTFTRNGICCHLQLESGNPADSKTFEAMAAELKEKYPLLKIWSLDDGYASVDNYKMATEKLGIEKLSLSGAKGKNATPDELYDSEEFQQYRNERSAVESYIGVHKSFFDMDRLSSRGLARVRREIMSKIIAANFCKMHDLRDKAAKEATAA